MLCLPVAVLMQLGVTDGARYVTSNSGGSWLNAAFSFQQKARLMLPFLVTTAKHMLVPTTRSMLASGRHHWEQQHLAACSAACAFRASALLSLTVTFNTVFVLQYPVSAFLGTYIPPDQLSLANVRATAAPETFESAIASAELLAPGVLGEKDSPPILRSADMRWAVCNC